MVLLAAAAPFWPPVLWSLVLILPLSAVGFYDLFQERHSICRNFPLFGRGRWLMEALRPYVREYFVESDTDGTPVNRMFRSIVYQRAKGARDTVPFGARVDTYRTGYEWIGHSLAAVDAAEVELDLRVSVGGPQCGRPYQASIFNISAMSFGALSPNAVLPLNKGARLGGFAHNTGEGGISPYHLEHGGEGGTGAAPLEYANSIGMPLREALALVVDCLIGFGLRHQVRVIASGKILTGFHLVKHMALGADLCNGARGMMFALGCVHSLVCNTNRCPSGVATQDPRLYRRLDVEDVAQRVVDVFLSFDTELKKIIAPLGRSTSLPIGMADALGIDDYNAAQRLKIKYVV